MAKAINIIFDGPPAHKSGRFIEIETDKGESLKIGEWIDKGDGLWALRITELPTNKYKVWNCKIAIPFDSDYHFGFDSSPRSAAIKAIRDAGIEVIGCFSGWNGTLTESEIKILEE